MNKLLFNSAIRLAMGALSFYLAQKGFNSSDIDSLNQIILSLMGSGAVAGLALTWSASEKKANKVVTPVVLAVDPIESQEITVVGKGYFLGDRSTKNLLGVHPDLVTLMQTAIISAPFDFTVTEGVRTMERQKELFAARPKVTKTLRSKHLVQDDG